MCSTLRYLGRAHELHHLPPRAHEDMTVIASEIGFVCKLILRPEALQALISKPHFEISHSSTYNLHMEHCITEQLALQDSVCFSYLLTPSYNSVYVLHEMVPFLREVHIIMSKIVAQVMSCLSPGVTIVILQVPQV